MNDDQNFPTQMPGATSDTMLTREADSVHYSFDNRGLDFDFRAIWASIYRSRYPIIAIIIGCLALGIIVTLLTTPIYRASASVQIDQEAAKILGTEQTNASSAIQDSERFLQTQLDIIRSRALTVSVAEELGLFGNAEFVNAMGYDLADEASGSLSLNETRREQIISLIDENLAVDLPVDSRVVKLSFNSPDPRLAVQVANGFAEGYIRSNLNRKFDASAYAREFLKEQLDAAQVRLSESERAAVDYSRRAEIIDTGPSGQGSASGSSSVTTATLVSLNEAYAAALARRIAAQGIWEGYRKTPRLSQGKVLDNAAIQKLLEERAKLSADYKEQLQRRKADYPTVRQAKARIDELNDQISKISQGISSSVRAEYESALAEERSISRQINRLKKEKLDEQSKSVQLTILQREADTNRKLYDMLLQRYNELSAEAGVQSNNVAIVDKAAIPTRPVSPKPLLNLALTALLGLALSGLFVFGRENLFDIIRTPDDVKNNINAPLIGAIPIAEDDASVMDEIVIATSPISESFNSIRSSLMLSSSHGAPKSISFSSTQQGEGKSSTCIATAISLGRLGKRVLLIDFDLRRPNVHATLNLKNDYGAADLLSSGATIDDAIQETAYSNLFAITCGAIPPDPTGLLAAERAREILSELENRFDIVLVDGPPVLGLADAVLTGAMTEKVIFVIESGANHRSSVKSAIERLTTSGANILGVILTKYDSNASGYGGYYQYQYKYNAKK